MNGTAPGVLGLPSRAVRWAAIAGILVGIAYACSPLTVLFTLAMVLVTRLAVRGIDGDERRWILAVLVAAIALRAAAIAGLFLLTNHSQVPFGSFFGDEEYFIKRSIWLRNVALGIPIHRADLIYAFDDYSQTSYLYVLAFVQTLFGPAPYGVHLLGVTLYLSATVVLFRTVRDSLGRMPALFGLILLLFLPSLFAWSISALKEPLFFFLTASGVAFAVRVVRAPGWGVRLAALVALVILGAAVETVRAGGAGLSGASIVSGFAIAWLIQRPRWILVTIVAIPIAVGAVLSRPAAQVKAYSAVVTTAQQHWGHIATPGYVYKTLDERLYAERSEISDIHFSEALRYIVRSIERYLTVPLPWEVHSRAALAFLPEQMVWYVLVVLSPLGIWTAFRRDPLISGLLLSHALIAALLVALTSGNVGTLVRHRGMALPYVAWLSAVGLCALMKPAPTAVS